MHPFIHCSALVVLGVAGCSTSHPLPANYAPTQAAISAADAVGAQQQPQGALHLKMARDQVATARAYSNEGKDRESALMLDRARADAEMALMVAREANADSAAKQAELRVQQLSPNQ